MTDQVAQRSLSDTLARGVPVQIRIVGALMMRELHTRFGRDNIGYLWLVLEPLILSLGVSSFHIFTHVSLPYGFEPGSFYASGYITYIVFRNNVSRATGMVESNKPLLFHKQVTLLDMVIARSALDAVASLGAMIVVLGLFFVVGLAKLPERPAYILLGLGLMTWLSFGVSMMVAGGMVILPLLDRIVHPLMYLLLPLSGVFTVLDELPRPFAEASSWIVLPQVVDIARQGLVGSFESTYVNYGYIVLMCSIVTLLGLVMLRIARRRMHFD